MQTPLGSWRRVLEVGRAGLVISHIQTFLGAKPPRRRATGISDADESFSSRTCRILFSWTSLTDGRRLLRAKGIVWYPPACYWFVAQRPRCLRVGAR